MLTFRKSRARQVLKASLNSNSSLSLWCTSRRMLRTIMSPMQHSNRSWMRMASRGRGRQMKGSSTLTSKRFLIQMREFSCQKLWRRKLLIRVWMRIRSTRYWASLIITLRYKTRDRQSPTTGPRLTGRRVWPCSSSSSKRAATSQDASPSMTPSTRKKTLTLPRISLNRISWGSHSVTLQCRVKIQFSILANSSSLIPGIRWVEYS